MTTTQASRDHAEVLRNRAANDLAAMLADKVQQAQANGATLEQAIAAVRALWLQAVSA